MSTDAVPPAVLVFDKLEAYEVLRMEFFELYSRNVFN